VLGQRYHDAGYRVVLSGHRVFTRNRALGLRAFLARHLRWAQLRRHVALPPFLFEPLAYPTPWLVALLGVVSTASAGSPELRANALDFALLVSVARMSSDAWLAWRVAGQPPALRALAFLPLKDCAMLGIWAVALLRRTVVWRGHTLRIGPGSRVTAPLFGRRRFATST
jgi:ceramide glucosyltransferase